MASDPADSPLSTHEATTLHVRRAVHGDRESLGWVISRFTPLLKAQAAYRLGAQTARHIDVEDLVAEAWLVALRRLSDLVQKDGRHTPRLLAFLSTTILNLVNHRLDRQIRREDGGQGPESRANPGTAEPLDQRAVEMSGAITRAIFAPTIA